MVADLRFLKTSWPAESATLEQARALRKRLLKSWRQGSSREREIARIVGQCRKGKRCGSPECPVCERRRRRRAKHRSAMPAAPSEVRQPISTVVLVRTSEIVPERVEWIWPGVIAGGRVTGLVGYPGLGKSQVGIDIAATVSTGRHWPGGAVNGNAGHVIILSAEDDAADTIVPRLIAARADRTRVQVVKAVKGDDGVERAFNLAVDLDRLENEYDLRQVKLVVIDPVSAYLGTTTGKHINRNHGGDVRNIHDRLGAFAAKHELAVLAVSHLNKTNGARAITRIMGSLEWVAAPRAVFLVTEEAGTGRRLFLPLKNNLAPDRIGYAFEIENKVVADDIRTSGILWNDDPVTISADEALAAAAKKVTSGAIDFLQQVLSDGPMDQTEIVRLGKEAGYSEKNLWTARERLGIKPKKEGFGADGKWVWVPTSSATALKLVVDNDANQRTPPDKKQPPPSGVVTGDDGGQGAHRDQDKAVPELEHQDSDPEGPDGGDAA
jgi:putative DNA primase/helicase